jgi:hypothetical protein
MIAPLRPPRDTRDPPMKDADGTFPLQPTPNWTLGQEMVWERSAVRRMAEALGRDYDEVDAFILERWHNT